MTQKTTVLHTNIEQVNEEFRKNLKAAFPKLTENEIELCALMRVRMDSKEISALKNVAVSSLRTLRYRIRKKLGIDASIDITDFLQKF